MQGEHINYKLAAPESRKDYPGHLWQGRERLQLTTLTKVYTEKHFT